MVDLGEAMVKPETSIRVLGLHIDGKLRWGPHLAKTKAKMATQTLGLSVVAGSTWGAILSKARQVYSAVVRPAMTYVAGSWHNPRGTPGSNRTKVKVLEKIQNQCLRTVFRAFKVTSVTVLEAEARIPPIEIHLDQLVIRA